MNSNKQVVRGKMIGIGRFKNPSTLHGDDVNWFKNSRKREFRQRLFPSQRIDILHEWVVHKMESGDISTRLGFDKATIIKVLRGYIQNERIFKLLPTHSK